MAWQELQSRLLVEEQWNSDTKEGNSPVGENSRPPVRCFLSRTAPVKRGLNLGGPPSKAKYSLMTDSGLVP